LIVNTGYVTSVKKTIDIITSGCPILAKNEYLMRHDSVSARLQY